MKAVANSPTQPRERERERDHAPKSARGQYEGNTSAGLSRIEGKTKAYLISSEGNTSACLSKVSSEAGFSSNIGSSTVRCEILLLFLRHGAILPWEREDGSSR